MVIFDMVSLYLFVHKTLQILPLLPIITNHSIYEPFHNLKFKLDKHLKKKKQQQQHCFKLYKVFCSKCVINVLSWQSEDLVSLCCLTITMKTQQSIFYLLENAVYILTCKDHATNELTSSICVKFCDLSSHTKFWGHSHMNVQEFCELLVVISSLFLTIS